MKDDLKAGLGEVIAVHTTTKARVIPSCGMHIHVSFNNSYTLNEVQRIAKAVVYFEDALFQLLPRSHRSPRKFLQSLTSAKMQNLRQLSRAPTPLRLPTR